MRFVAAVIVAGTAAMGLAQGPAVAPPPTVASAPPAVQEFDLGDLLDPGPREFRLFLDSRLPELPLSAFPPSPWGDGYAPVAPLGRMRAIGLEVALREEVGPDGKPRLMLVPLHPKWENLTPWEKVSVSLQYAGAAAALGHFIGKLF